MELNRLQEKAIMTALNEIKSELDVNVYTENELDGAPLVWGVNWAAMGTQPTQAARQYGENIKKAADIADTLTSCEFIYTYAPSNSADKITAERFEKFTKAVKIALELDDAALLKKVLENMTK